MPWLAAAALLGCCAALSASEFDLSADPFAGGAEPVELAPEKLRKAEAMARFAKGIFDEESEGPERAMESYRRVLELDPTFSTLALRMAQEYLRRGDSTEAIQVLKDSIKEAPGDYLPPLILANIYLRHLRKPDLALTYAQQALKHSPESFPAHEMLWEIYQYQGRKAEADAVLDRALASDSTDAEFWLQLADVFRRIQPPGQSPPAELGEKMDRALYRAVELAEDQPELLSKAAEYFVLGGRLAEALPLYERVYELKPEHPNILEKLATSYLETGAADRARPLFEKMLETNRQSLIALDNLAAITAAAEEYDKAIEYRQRIVILQPFDERRHQDVIFLLLETGRYETLVHATGEARDRFPRNGFLSFLHAVALRLAERPIEAIPVFEEAIIEAGHGYGDYLNADFYFEYGVAAEQAGLYEQAAELFKKSIELHPGAAAMACNYLGYMWVERNEHLEEAEKLIRRALAAEPNNGAYVDSLGWLYYRLGRYEDALAELLRAAELLDRPDPVVYDHIGDTYHKLERPSDALLYWRKALQMDPENKEIITKADETAEAVAKQPTVPANTP